MTRIADDEGHLWPVTGHRCPVCRMPADPSLDDGPHPSCLPARDVDDDSLTAAVDLLAEVLGAETIATHDTRWRISGAPLPIERDMT